MYPDFSIRLGDIAPRGLSRLFRKYRPFLVTGRTLRSHAVIHSQIADRHGADSLVLLAVAQILDANGRVVILDFHGPHDPGADSLFHKLGAFYPAMKVATRITHLPVITRLLHPQTQAAGDARLVYARDSATLSTDEKNRPVVLSVLREDLARRIDTSTDPSSQTVPTLVVMTGPVVFEPGCGLAPLLRASGGALIHVYHAGHPPAATALADCLTSIRIEQASAAEGRAHYRAVVSGQAALESGSPGGAPMEVVFEAVVVPAAGTRQTAVEPPAVADPTASETGRAANVEKTAQLPTESPRHGRPSRRPDRPSRPATPNRERSAAPVEHSGQPARRTQENRSKSPPRSKRK